MRQEECISDLILCNKNVSDKTRSVPKTNKSTNVGWRLHQLRHIIEEKKFQTRIDHGDESCLEFDISTVRSVIHFIRSERPTSRMQADNFLTLYYFCYVISIGLISIRQEYHVSYHIHTIRDALEISALNQSY